MPELRLCSQRWTVAAGSNLLDALHAAGCPVSSSCRAGSCQACLVRCVRGEPEDARPDALSVAQRERGWRLACQCRVTGDLEVALFDPAADGLAAEVVGLDWLEGDVLRLRLVPERPVRYRAGQHALLWTSGGVARPYSLASLPGEDAWLEFHLDCRHRGAFCDVARTWHLGASLRLGPLQAGALRYEAEWQTQPLLLLAAGTGLAPLWGVLREALRQEHAGPIRLIHCVDGPSYLQASLLALATRHDNLSVELTDAQGLSGRLEGVATAARRQIALVCGGDRFVQGAARRLFLAGVPRGQLLSDTFLRRPIDR